MTLYTNHVVWKGGHLGFSTCENGAAMDFSAPPSLYGHPHMMTPEDAYMMAVNTCMHMMILWAAERFKLNLVAFECEAVGEVEELIDQTSWFRSVTLKPRLKVQGASEKSVLRALQVARKYSTIAESLKSEIIMEPSVEIV